MPYERADFRRSALAGAWYFVWTLILVPIDSATLSSPLALIRSVLIRLAVVAAFMVASHLYIGTQDVVFDSIVPKPPEPPVDPAQSSAPPVKPPAPRLDPADRWLIATFAGFWMLERLAWHWHELIPDRFTWETPFEWCWWVLISVFMGIVTRALLFDLDPETRKRQLAVRADLVVVFTLFFLGINIFRHIHSLLLAPSILHLILGCIRQSINALVLGAGSAYAVKAVTASIKNVGRPKLISFSIFAGTVFAVVAYWDRKNLLAVQPGRLTISAFVLDLAFAFLIALFLHRRLVQTFSPDPIEIPSIVPHPLGPTPVEQNPVANSGV